MITDPRRFLGAARAVYEKALAADNSVSALLDKLDVSAANADGADMPEVAAAEEDKAEAVRAYRQARNALPRALDLLEAALDEQERLLELAGRQNAEQFLDAMGEAALEADLCALLRQQGCALLAMEDVVRTMQRIEAKLDRLLAERPPGQLTPEEQDRLFDEMEARMAGEDQGR